MPVAETASTRKDPRGLPAPVPLTSSMRPVATLSPRERDAMWMLYARFYRGTSAARFHADLDDKDTALLLHDACGSLRGFSTLVTSSRDIAGVTVRVLFSGDTIVDREHWGSQSLAFGWLRHA